MNVRLNDIQYFLAIAEHGKVRAAALALGVSQPAVTQGIQRLEKEMGFRLFERSASGMRPTGVARQFRDKVQAIQAELKGALAEAGEAHLGELGILRVGVSPLYVQRLFVPAATALHQQRPAARLKLMLHLNETLLASLRGGEIDLAINALPAEVPEDLEATPLVGDALCLVVREHHPLLSKPELKLPDLAGALWMLPGEGVAVRRKIEDRLGRCGLPSPDVVIEISTSALGQLNRLVRQSDLVTVMSESMLHTPWGEGLSPLPFEDARYSRTIGILTRKSAELPPLAPRFMELLARYASSTEAEAGSRRDEALQATGAAGR